MTLHDITHHHTILDDMTYHKIRHNLSEDVVRYDIT